MLSYYVRKTLSVAALGIVAFALLEAISFGVYSVLNGSAFTFHSAAMQRNDAARSTTAITVHEVLAGQVKVLHPYVGYVYDATKRDFLHAGIAISEFGFPDDNSLIQQRSKDKLIIGILGGSVAWWFQSLGYKAFEAELRQVPAFRDRELVVVRMALGGFKQPQQLMAYTYALALGGEFDMLINIDGFNEIALYSFGSHVNPFFPHEWQFLASNAVEPDHVARIGMIKVLEEHRARLASAFSSSFAQYSITATLVWQLSDRYLQRLLAEARQDFTQPEGDENVSAFATVGPPFDYSTVDAFYVRLAAGWARCSLAIHGLSTAHDTKYFHFLQPNQYVANSKRRLSSEERAEAYRPDNAWAVRAARGYRSLLESGKELEQHGVKYHDLTKVFADESGTMFADSCCHITEAGNKIMGRKIGRIVAATYLAEAQ